MLQIATNPRGQEQKKHGATLQQVQELVQELVQQQVQELLLELEQQLLQQLVQELVQQVVQELAQHVVQQRGLQQFQVQGLNEITPVEITYKAFAPIIKFLEQGWDLKAGVVVPMKVKPRHMEKTIVGLFLATAANKAPLDGTTQVLMSKLAQLSDA